MVPNSLHDMLLWVSERYNYPRIFVTENGVSDPVDQGESVNAALNDNFRINFFEGDSRFVVNSLMTKTCDTDWIALHLLALLYAGYLAGVMNAMQKGVKVDGYFAWSLIVCIFLCVLVWLVAYIFNVSSG